MNPLEKLQPFIDLAVTTGQISADDAERITKAVHVEYFGKLHLIPLSKVKQIADIDTRTLKQWINDKKIRGYKPGGHLMIDQKELTRFLRASEVIPPI